MHRELGIVPYVEFEIFAENMPKISLRHFANRILI